MVMYGYDWVSRVIYGYVGLCIGIILWVCSVMYGYVGLRMAL